jgi:hypothetical protein
MAVAAVLESSLWVTVRHSVLICVHAPLVLYQGQTSTCSSLLVGQLTLADSSIFPEEVIPGTLPRNWHPPAAAAAPGAAITTVAQAARLATRSSDRLMASHPPP